jgi:hypothetical protein
VAERPTRGGVKGHLTPLFSIILGGIDGKAEMKKISENQADTGFLPPVGCLHG